MRALFLSLVVTGSVVCGCTVYKSAERDTFNANAAANAANTSAGTAGAGTADGGTTVKPTRCWITEDVVLDAKGESYRVEDHRVLIAHALVRTPDRTLVCAFEAPVPPSSEEQARTDVKSLAEKL